MTRWLFVAAGVTSTLWLASNDYSWEWITLSVALDIFSVASAVRAR